MTRQNLLIGAGAIGLACWLYAGQPIPGGTQAPISIVAVDLKQAAAPVTQSLAGHPKLAKNLAAVFDRAAAVIESSPDLIRTTADVRSYATYCARAIVTTDKEPVPPGFVVAATAVMDAAVGTREQQNLTPELRTKSANGFRAIAFGCRGAR